jgi:hypothetical protein
MILGSKDCNGLDLSCTPGAAACRAKGQNRQGGLGFSGGRVYASLRDNKKHHAPWAAAVRQAGFPAA